MLLMVRCASLSDGCAPVRSNISAWGLQYLYIYMFKRYFNGLIYVYKYTFIYVHYIKFNIHSMSRSYRYIMV